VKRRLTLITEIIAPYRIPVFNALARHSDIDLHVIFLAETDSAMRQWRIYKEEIHFSYEVLRSLRFSAGISLLLNWGLSAALRKAHPDAVLCGGYNYPASWWAAYWCRAQRIPFLLWIESTAADQRAGRPLVEALKTSFMRLCHGFVVPGRASSDYLRAFRVDASRVFTAPNAIDLALFEDLAARARAAEPQLRAQLQLPPRYFLNTGRLIEAKGVFDLIEAYAKLDPGLRSQIGLVFAGDGAVRAQLESLAKQISPGDILFPGFVQRDDLPPYYAFADALVFPTHSDTWGFVVNEAMACGIPVIASNVAGAVADLVEEKVTGLIVPPRNSVELSNAMALLASDPGLRRNMAAQAAMRIAAFSPEACADGIARAAVSAADRK
jgi:glycosyltransferase involved in cell wall biosynthesis